jgi:hypothetical protein
MNKKRVSVFHPSENRYIFSLISLISPILLISPIPTNWCMTTPDSRGGRENWGSWGRMSRSYYFLEQKIFVNNQEQPDQDL